MADEPENRVLVYLRRLDAKLDRIALRLGDLTQRVGAVAESVVRLACRSDDIDRRLDRVETPLGLIDPALR